MCEDEVALQSLKVLAYLQILSLKIYAATIFSATLLPLYSQIVAFKCLEDTHHTSNL